AATIIEEDFRDVSELGGLFSGWENDWYCPDTWQYEGVQRVVHLHQQYKDLCLVMSSEAHSFHGGRCIGGPPLRSPAPQATLRAVHPRRRLGDLRRPGRAARADRRDDARPVRAGSHERD